MNEYKVVYTVMVSAIDSDMALTVADALMNTDAITRRVELVDEENHG